MVLSESFQKQKKNIYNLYSSILFWNLNESTCIIRILYIGNKETAKRAIIFLSELQNIFSSTNYEVYNTINEPLDTDIVFYIFYVRTIQCMFMVFCIGCF